MSLRRFLSRLLCVLLPLAITSSLYLYLYPVFHRCAFPLPGDSNKNASFLNTLRQHLTLTPHNVTGGGTTTTDPAIFRLLVLADPQLEGDSSLPKRSDELPARLHTHWDNIRHALADAYEHAYAHASDASLGVLQDRDSQVYGHVYTAVSDAVHALATNDIPRAVRAARKRLDLLGNDYYLAHIYRSLAWWTRPTHVTVLGDLIGSQWVTDGEFERRGWRYWERVFAGGERVEDELIGGARGFASATDDEDGYRESDSDSELETLNASSSNPWARRIINVVGNHDIGYSGDASAARIERFERMFGRANWDIRFQHPPLPLPSVDNTTTTITPTLHLINLNTLTLDAPPFSTDIQAESYAYVNDLILQRSYPVEDRTTFTLLLTHLPLHKADGVCTDGPYFTFFDADDEKGGAGGPRYRAGGLREQNHLSDVVSSTGVLQGIFGMSGDEDAPAGGRGRNGLILTGHDHTGCDVVHFVDRNPAATTDQAEGETSWTWNARRYGDPAVSVSVSGDGEEQTPPSIREVTLRSMMGEFGGYAALLSLWFDPDPAVLEWKYEITMCSAGVQHIWWAVHVVDLVAGLLLGVYMCVTLVGSRKRPVPTPTAAPAPAKEVKKGEKMEKCK